MLLDSAKLKMDFKNIADGFKLSSNATAPTMWPFLFNITQADIYTEFARTINATSWANLQPQNIHERAEVILLQPETILTLIFSFLALLANCMSICATASIPHGLTTHSKLIISLALSDILVTISVFTHILNKVFNTAKIPPMFSPEERLTSSCMFAFINGLNTMAHLISLFNLAAMALDHYIAILRPLHYRQLMSRGRGNVLIAILWIIATVGGFSNFLTGIGTYKDKAKFINYCELIMYNDYHGEYLVMTVTFLCLILITIIYGRIYFEVKSINTRLAQIQKDCLHNKKALITTLLIIGTFIVCWLPTCIFQIAMIIQINIDQEVVQKLFSALLRANKYLYALLILNCLCDPIIYAVRLSDVQLGYYRLLSHCCSRYKTKLKDKGQNSYMERRSTRTKSIIVDIEEMDNLREEKEETPLNEIPQVDELTLLNVQNNNNINHLQYCEKST